MLKWLSKVIGWGRLAGFGLLFLLLFIRIADPIFIERLRLQAFDLYQQLNPREAPPAPVAILDVDDASLAEVGQWPWPRTKIAEMTQKAMQAGAVALAFDIVFSEPDRLSPANIAADNPDLPADVRNQLKELPSNDDVLAQTFAQGRVVVGQTSIRAGSLTDTGPPPRAVPHAVMGASPDPHLIQFPDLVENLPQLEDAAAGHGMFSVFPDPDGVFRRVPIVMAAEGVYRLGLSIELLRIATGGQAFAIRTNDAGIDGVVVARQLIKTAPDGTVWNNFSPHDPNRYVSAADLLSGRIAPNRLAGHLVLVGTSAIGLEDFRATPLGLPMAGVEIHAQVLENILSQSMLFRPNWAIGMELVWIAGMSLLVIALAPAMSARYLFLITAALIGGSIWGSYTQYTNNLQLLDPTFPVLAVLLTFMLMSSINYFMEEARRQQIRGAFGQYVSPDLVAELADDPDKLKLGGEKRELTILFTDVRGFTTISEAFKDDPAGLTSLMNRFLTIMSNAIMDHGGTIDKYMGDAIMAFWNAPLDTPDHPKKAAASALQMLNDVAALNATLAADPDAPKFTIDIGIGINTGDCVVGNMGSDKRFDYSALGDSVNLASRLEGQTKAYGVNVILGRTTREETFADYAVIELDLIRVKGKELPEQIFALMGDAALRGTAEFARLSEANAALITCYRAQGWAAAREALSEMESAAAGLDLDIGGYVQMYRDRIDDFEAAPPGEDWDGVYVATSK
ncbi:MAG: adenylate/guanylate cyclase domain-containing protein [Rhodobacteraceae bacterium]|nr:adenylate/guanylate cyclase domain-containing protein [Paracoccaceae bacterium]